MGQIEKQKSPQSIDLRGFLNSGGGGGTIRFVIQPVEMLDIRRFPAILGQVFGTNWRETHGRQPDFKGLDLARSSRTAC